MWLLYCMKIFLENLVCCEDGETVIVVDIEVLVRWDVKVEFSYEIVFVFVWVIF